MSDQESLKKLVGYKSVDDHVKSNMVIGLGTGSTAYYAVERVGELLKSGALTNVIAIPTSLRTMEQAKELGIPLTTLNDHSVLDVAIDGADSVDSNLNLIKGGGGALFREKIVEVQAKKFVVIVDESKLVDKLGPHFPLPVEVLPFCAEHTRRNLEGLPTMPEGTKAVLRLGSSSNNKVDGSEPAVTDNGCYIIDLFFANPITDPKALGDDIIKVVGVVEHGLFVGMADEIIVAGSEGIEVRKRK
jgi:ribose 5-phosphate isomerase A